MLKVVSTVEPGQAPIETEENGDENGGELLQDSLQIYKNIMKIDGDVANGITNTNGKSNNNSLEEIASSSGVSTVVNDIDKKEVSEKEDKEISEKNEKTTETSANIEVKEEATDDESKTDTITANEGIEETKSEPISSETTENLETKTELDESIEPIKEENKQHDDENESIKNESETQSVAESVEKNGIEPKETENEIELAPEPVTPVKENIVIDKPS